jgi:hypothetical protein
MGFDSAEKPGGSAAMRGHKGKPSAVLAEGRPADRCCSPRRAWLRRGDLPWTRRAEGCRPGAEITDLASRAAPEQIITPAHAAFRQREPA